MRKRQQRARRQPTAEVGQTTDPTSSEVETVTFILNHIRAHGYQPSLREISQHFGVTVGAVQFRLLRLQEHGLVRLRPAARAIELPGFKFEPVVVPEEADAARRAG